MFNLNVLKSLSISLLMCPLLSSAMEPQIPSGKSKKNENERLIFTPDIDVPEMAWVNLKPYLENLIQSITADPTREKTMIHFKRLEKDSEDYCAWENSLRESFSHLPISINSANDGFEDSKVDGKYEKYHSFLCIKNHTKTEEKMRAFPYKIFGGKFDESQMSQRVFYEVMANIGFSPDDFAEGKYGYQDQIYVKPIHLNNKTLDACAVEMKEAILSTLEKVGQPYVTFIIELDKSVPYTIFDLRSCFHEINPHTKIFAPDENRVYVVYYNDKRLTLDLHGLSMKEAKEKVVDFITEKYNNFETECTIITGRGNHTSANGSAGIFKKTLPAWLKSDALRFYVQDCKLGEGGGLYKIALVEPVHINLNTQVFEEDVEKVIWFILNQDEKGHDRLRIIHENQTSDYIDKVLIKAMLRLSRMPSAPKSYDYVFTASEHQLVWYEQEESSDEESALVFQVKGPNVRSTIKF